MLVFTLTLNFASIISDAVFLLKIFDAQENGIKYIYVLLIPVFFVAFGVQCYWYIAYLEIINFRDDESKAKFLKKIEIK